MHLLGAEGTLLLQDLGLLVLKLLVDLGALGWLVAVGSRLRDVSSVVNAPTICSTYRKSGVLLELLGLEGLLVRLALTLGLALYLVGK